MNEDFKLDYYRMTGEHYKSGIKSIIRIIASHQIRFVRLWRKSKKRQTLIKRLRLLKYARKYGIEVSHDAEIGRGLYLGHPYNITAGAGVKIGDNVNLHKGCTIGRENRGKRKGAPVI